MSIPEVTCNADLVVVEGALPYLASLGAVATGAPIQWRWLMISVPLGSAANSGVNGDFTHGVSTIQSPDFTADVRGSYVLQAQARNLDGWSVVEDDRESGQQIVVAKSAVLDLPIPGDKQYDWASYMDDVVRKLEATLLSHVSRHANGGADELSVAGLTGLLADEQDPLDHAADHQNGGGDQMSVAGLTGLLADEQDPLDHSADHQNGGGDELDVTGLSGVLADPQTAATHAASHENGGGDELSVADLSGLLADPQTPLSHALDSAHSAPSDSTVNDASAAAHGLLPKLTGNAADALLGDGSWGVAGSVSPLTAKGDIYGRSGVADARLPVGVDDTILRADSGGALGLRWGIEATAHENEFATLGTETPGDPAEFHLDYIPRGSGALDTPSGYDLLVFREGSKLKWSAAPSAYDEFSFDPITNNIRIIADGTADRFEVYYQSTSDAPFVAGTSSTYGSATFGTDTFGPEDVAPGTFGSATYETDTFGAEEESATFGSATFGTGTFGG